MLDLRKEKKELKKIEQAGFNTAQEFVQYVLDNATRTYEVKNSPKKKTKMQI